MKTNQTFGLAPMEGVTEAPTRLWFALTSGPDSIGTPFLRVTHTFPINKEQIFSKWPELGHPSATGHAQFVPQLMASDPVRFVEAAKLVLEHHSFVEINCGCPAPKVVGNGAGSSLLVNPESFRKNMSFISNELGPQKLAIKMRTGYDNDSNFIELIDCVKDLSLKHVCIHGRTKAERYKGHANWDLITSAARILKNTTTIGSGDICSSKKFVSLGELPTNLSHIIIGRGALRNPWIFKELRSGESISISRDLLMYSLGLLALLIESEKKSPFLLKQLIEKKYFSHPLNDIQNNWMNHYQLFFEESKRKFIPPEKLCLSTVTLGRLKQIWRSLRSSLADVPFENKILRTKSTQDFFTILNSHCPNDMTISHNPLHDWMFAGEANPNSRN